VTYHVLEAPDPAVAIVDYGARANRVDHIVIGSRALFRPAPLSGQRLHSGRGRGAVQWSPW